MFKRVKTFGPALLADDAFRSLVEGYESEFLRGLNTLVVLRVIHENDGAAYGYMILKEIEERTRGLLVMEEGTLYPLLRKLQQAGVLEATTGTAGGRTRKYFSLSPKGVALLDVITGFTSGLVQAIAPALDASVGIDPAATACPNCTCRLRGDGPDANRCKACGMNVLPATAGEGQ